MAREGFNLVDWFNNKLKEDNGIINLIGEKINEISGDIKKKMLELTDDSNHIVPILNGLHGDSMEEKGHPALVKMSFRHGSRDIAVENITEFIDFKENNGRLILMIHGLMNDETIWQSDPNDKTQYLGSFLESQKKANILYVRYNTGRHISQNGRDLSALIQQLFDTYPNQINEFIMIGHSMGGLVTRSTCHYAGVLNHSWIKMLKMVFLIGVPNEGSYLARVGYMGQYFARKVDPTENDTFAKFFDVRSNGIKDLSFGFLVDEDWKNPKYENEKEIKSTRIYPLPNVDYYLLAAVVADKESKNKIFNFFGDGLVEKESALTKLFTANEALSGKVNFKLFDKVNHLTLLESTDVQKYMIESLGW